MLDRLITSPGENHPSFPWSKFLPKHGDVALQCSCDCDVRAWATGRCLHGEYERSTIYVDLDILAEHCATWRSHKRQVDRIEASSDAPAPANLFSRPGRSKYELHTAPAVAALLCAMLPGDREYLQGWVEIQHLTEALTLSREWRTADKVRDTLLSVIISLIASPTRDHLREAQHKNLRPLFVETYLCGASACELLKACFAAYSRNHCGGAPALIAPLTFSDEEEDRLGDEGVRYWKTAIAQWRREKIISARKPTRKRRAELDFSTMMPLIVFSCAEGNLGHREQEGWSVPGGPVA